MFFKTSNLAILLLAIALSSLGKRSLHAEINDSFEEGEPRWTLWRNDLDARLVGQDITTGSADTGQRYERIDITTNQLGSFGYLVYSIPPAAIIDELSVRLALRSAAGGLKIGFRAVFPNAVDPQTRQPLTQVLYGEEVSLPGTWSTVSVVDPIAKLASQQRVLRSEFGSQIDLREAYIDAVVIDIFNGVPSHRIYVDSLQVSGLFDPRQTPAPDSLLATPSDSGYRATRLGGLSADERSMDGLGGAGDFASDVRLAERTRDLQSEVPIWIQYNGEPLPWLSQYGVNGVVALDQPSHDLLKQANQSRIKLIASPPSVTPPEKEWREWSAVDGWLLGSALNNDRVNDSRQLRNRLLRMPTELVRPTVSEAMENVWSYARLSDFLALPAPLPTTVNHSTEMLDQIGIGFANSKGNAITLASITTELPDEWFEQCSMTRRALNIPNLRIEQYDLLQHRMQLFRSLVAGVRGWYFRSLNRLDSGSPADVLRASAIRATAAELELLEPWIRGVPKADRLPANAVAGYDGAVFPMQGADLVVLFRAGEFDQCCAVAPDQSSLEIPIVTPGGVGQAFRISRGRTEPLRSVESHEGKVAMVEDPGFVELVVVTSSPEVIGYLKTITERNVDSIAEGRIDIASQLLRVAQLNLVAMQLPSGSVEWALIKQAESDMRSALYQLQNRRYGGAIEGAEQVAIVCQRVIRDGWERAAQQFQTPQDSPLLATPLSLPLHYRLTGAIGQRDWHTVNFPAGDCDDVSQMLAAGFELNQRLNESVDSSIQIAVGAGTVGDSSLKLVANSKTGHPIPGGFEGSSLLLSSPPIKINQGEMYRIDMLVRFEAGFAEPQSGLLVYDSSVGPAFGQLVTPRRSPQLSPVNSNDANPGRWQRVTQYRMATSESFHIHLELRGGGTVIVDQFTASTITPLPFPRHLFTPAISPLQDSESAEQSVLSRPVYDSIGNPLQKRPLRGQDAFDSLSSNQDSRTVARPARSGQGDTSQKPTDSITTFDSNWSINPQQHDSLESATKQLQEAAPNKTSASSINLSGSDGSKDKSDLPNPNRSGNEP